MNKINRKVRNSIVTGGSRGIGRDIALTLASEGINVAILDLVDNKEDFKSLLKKGCGEITFYKCDLTNREEINSFLDKAYKKYGSINYLINNAIYKNQHGINEPLEEWNKSISVGLTAPFLLSQELINREKNGGSIINICSVAARLSTSESPSYHAAKGGLLALSRHLAVEGGKKSFRVNAILPGLIIQDDHLDRFNSIKNLKYREMCQKYQPMGKVGTQSDISKLVLFLCSDNSKYISGAEINIDGGATIQDQFAMLQNQLKNKT